MKPLLLLSCLIFCSLTSQAFTLPSGLDVDDQKRVVKELAIPTSTKFLSNPYPLGGFPGFEVGVSYQTLDTKEISGLGNTVDNDKDSLSIINVTLGKGLYNDVDLFFNFSPLNHSDNINGYGGLLKWSFFQAKFIPINFALLTFGNVIHMSDTFVNQTFGLELMAGVNVENIALYFGGGPVEGEGQFMGGQQGVVINSGDTSKIRQKLSHYFLGISLQSATAFIAAQMDNYQDTTFSFKLGLRF